MSRATVLVVGARDDLAGSDRFDVVRCPNPAWVVEAVERNTPDLILVDLNLPGLHGVEVVGDLRRSELSRFVPLVVLSPEQGISWRAELFRAGAADVLSDGLPPEEVKRRLSAVLEGCPWGGAAIGDAGPGPAVATIAELVQRRATGNVGLRRGDDAGLLRLQDGEVASIAVGPWTGEEALNVVAGSPGWEAKLLEPGAAAPAETRVIPVPRERLLRVGWRLARALLRPTRVLLVEDDDAVSKLYEIALTGAGYEVTTAERGHEGLDAARTDPPDLILSDVMMPGGDGWWLLTEVRRDFLLRDTPFLLFTNKGPGAGRQEVPGIEPQAVLQKELRLRRVITALEEVLRPGRDLLEKLAAPEPEALEGPLESLGAVSLLRAVATVGASGTVSLESDSGKSATLEVRGDRLRSAVVTGLEPAEGREALVHVVVHGWQRFRFERAAAAAAGEAPDLGPTAQAIREACEVGRRVYARLRVHALARAGRLEHDPALADAFGASAPVRAAKAVRSAFEGLDARAIASVTGLELLEVEQILFDLLRAGVVQLAGAGELVREDRPADPFAPAGAPEGGSTLVGEAERRAEQAERRAVAAEQREKAVAARAAVVEAEAKARVTTTEFRIAETLEVMRKRIEELERDAAGAAARDTSASVSALAAERAKRKELEAALHAARAEATRVVADAVKARRERDEAAAVAWDARLARDSAEQALAELRRREAGLVKALGRTREQQELLAQGGGADTAARAAEEAARARGLEEELAKLRAEAAGKEHELANRAAELAAGEAKLATITAALAYGERALQAARKDVEERVAQLSRREGEVSAREAEVRTAEMRLASEREALERTRAAAEAEGARLTALQAADSTSAAKILAELEKVRAAANRAAREAEAAKQATARMAAEAEADAERSRSEAAHVAEAQARWEELNRIWDEPTLIRVIPGAVPPRPGERGGEAARPAPGRPTPVPAPAPRLPPGEAGSSPPVTPAPAVVALDRAAGGRPSRGLVVGIGLGAAVLTAAIVVGAVMLSRHDGGAVAGDPSTTRSAAPITGAEYVPATRPASAPAAESLAAVTASPASAPASTAAVPGEAGDGDEVGVAGDPTEPGEKKKRKKKKKKKRTKPKRDPGGTAAMAAGTSGAEAHGHAGSEAHAFYDDGMAALLAGRNTRAVMLFKKATVADPAYADAWRGLTLSYCALRNAGAAGKALDRYLALRPGAEDAMRLREKVAALH